MIGVYVMKLKYHILVTTVVIVLLACAPTIKEPVRSDKAAMGTDLYEQAEKLYKANAYEDALELYNEYLIKYPDQSLADESF